LARFRVTLEYEGTRYSGWQIQRNARTVQGEIAAALAELFGSEDVQFMGSGRTDAGVHALAQVAHLDVDTMLAPEIIRMKVNDLLPPDINIIEVEKVRRAFHARHDAEARRYLYQISRRRTAFGKRYVWWVRDRLDLDAMRRTAAALTGFRDFRAFTDDDPEEKSTKVAIEECTVADSGDLILVRVTGSHFLWKLVRRMVGVLVESGRGRIVAAQLPGLLAGDGAAAARATAPPSGLFLERVFYPGESRSADLLPAFPVPRARDNAPLSHSHRTRHAR
jgi:tRNA pseudouridine38-40 synthase